jgi:SdpC family antimicrobial peptide
MIAPRQWPRAWHCISAIGFLLMGCTDVTGPPRTPAKTPDYNGQTLFRGMVLGTGPAADFLSSKTGTPKLGDVIRDPVQLKRVEAFQERLITSIDKVNPGFFDEFAAAMKSGRHTAIQAMFQHTTDVMLRTVLTLKEAETLRSTMADRQVVDQAVTSRMATLDRNDPKDRAAVREVVDALYRSVNDPELQKGKPSFQTRNVDGGGGGGGGGCVYYYLAAVYVGVAVDVAVVSNFVVAIAIGQYLAIGSASPTPETQLARERMVHAIATTFAT